jgi:hypothetical protein
MIDLPIILGEKQKWPDINQLKKEQDKTKKYTSAIEQLNLL